MGTNYSFALLIIIILFIPGLFFQKSKGIAAFELILLILLNGLYTSNNSDLYFYRAEYNRGYISSSPFEKIYELLTVALSHLGLPFDVFHFVLTALSFFIIGWVIFKISLRPALNISMLLGFATLEFALQIKAMCASAIITLALYFLFKKDDAWHKVLFLVFLIIASGFHFMAILFVPLLFYKVFDNRNVRRLIIIIVIMSFLIVPGAMRIARNIIPDLNTYEAELSPKTVILSVLWQIAGYILSKYLYKWRIEDNCFSDERNNFSKAVYLGSFALLIILPFYIFTNVIMRVIRVWSVFYIASVSDVEIPVTSDFKVFLSREGIIKLGYIIYLIFSFLAFFVWFAHADMVGEIISGNILLSFIFN